VNECPKYAACGSTWPVAWSVLLITKVFSRGRGKVMWISYGESFNFNNIHINFML
jgi:hypothetical protein